MPPASKTEAEQMVSLSLPEIRDMGLAQNYAGTLDPEGRTQSRKDIRAGSTVAVKSVGSRTC